MARRRTAAVWPAAAVDTPAHRHRWWPQTGCRLHGAACRRPAARLSEPETAGGGGGSGAGGGGSCRAASWGGWGGGGLAPGSVPRAGQRRFRSRRRLGASTSWVAQDSIMTAGEDGISCSRDRSSPTAAAACRSPLRRRHIFVLPLLACLRPSARHAAEAVLRSFAF